MIVMQATWWESSFERLIVRGYQEPQVHLIPRMVSSLTVNGTNAKKQYSFRGSLASRLQKLAYFR